MGDTTDNPRQPSGQTDPTPVTIDPAMKQVFTHHARRWQDFHYVYAVVSRRSEGLSIGINLNIDKACNFDCVYCCVDRSVPPVRKDVDLDQIRHELKAMLELASTGEIWKQPQFEHVTEPFRRINDIAFSGDGEPTTYPRFDEACQIAIDLKQEFDLQHVKIVVITNATMFEKPAVKRAFELLDHHQGEVWAKLDAGSEEYYRLIDRTKFPLQKVLDQIAACGQTRPIVIQSLFMQVHGEPVPDAEFDAYQERLGELIAGGCQIKLVQLYTTARWTAQKFVSPLTDAQLNRLADRFRRALPQTPVEVYYGVG